MIIVRRPRLRARRLVALLAAATAVLLAAACGSSGSSGSGSSGSSTAGSNGSKLSTADQAGLAQAEAFLAKAEARPTQITSTVKVSKPVPKGKTVYFITCGASPECTQEGPIVQQADDVLGWKTVILNNDGSPQQWKSDFDQVVRAKPAAVLYSAIPQSTFASEVPALKANGTFIAGGAASPMRPERPRASAMPMTFRRRSGRSAARRRPSSRPIPRTRRIR